ncbi:MAG TPA: 2'-5' RNA ligase family protein [Marmoricola sp.]|jgi:2'-5' RNA ligase|nr:2'-5' RNA ligase family protein [Marmoricola sp.]
MGHTVLAVPVVALEDEVRERTAYYDPSYVSADPAFVHAHITILAPWVPSPTVADLAAVAALAAAADPIVATFSEVSAFPDNGLIHLRPEPDDAFRALSAAFAQRYPGFPPYAGEFADPVPHLTLDHPAGGVTQSDVRDRVAGLLPITCTLDRLDLQWWAEDDCRLLRSWQFGAPP